MADDWGEVDPEEVPVPGSRPRAAHATGRREPEERWDAKPRVYRVNGVDTELFPIGALAQALNREEVTIRSWERKGWLPKPLLRAPRRDDIPGYRLYTRRYIEGVMRIAREEGIDKPGARIEFTGFPARVKELFEEVGG